MRGRTRPKDTRCAALRGCTAAVDPVRSSPEIILPRRRVLAHRGAARLAKLCVAARKAKTSDTNAEKQRKAKARLKEGKPGNAFFKFRDEAFARREFDIKNKLRRTTRGTRATPQSPRATNRTTRHALDVVLGVPVRVVGGVPWTVIQRVLPRIVRPTGVHQPDRQEHSPPSLLALSTNVSGRTVAFPSYSEPPAPQ